MSYFFMIDFKVLLVSLYEFCITFIKAYHVPKGKKLSLSLTKKKKVLLTCLSLYYINIYVLTCFPIWLLSEQLLHSLNYI